MKIDIKKAIPKHEVVIMTDPLGPIFLPNRPAVIDPTKGKNIRFKYMNSLYEILNF